MKNFKRTFLFLTLILLILVIPTGLFAGGQKEAELDSYPMMAFEPQELKATRAVDGEVVEINIFTTNDEHGWIFDWDYGQGGPRMSRGNPRPSGLARVSTLYKKLSAENDNSMLVSCGDSIQGTILSYYYNSIETEKLNPVTAIFSKMGYDAWSVGNHEVEQGNEVMLKVANEMAAVGIPVLSANAVWEDNQDKPYYKPYMIKEIDGVRIGFLGMTTPGIPMWLEDATHEDHVFLDMVKTAEKYVPILRDVEKCDVVVGLFHSGMNDEYGGTQAAALGVPVPNASALVAEAIGGGPNGIDVIITGHSHKQIDDEKNTEFRDDRNNVVNGVKFVQAKNWGERLGHISISVKGESSDWVVKDVSVKTYAMENVAEDPQIMKHMSEYINGAMAYAETPIADATADLPSLRSYYEESAIVELIQETQLHFSGADISLAAAFNPNLTIPEGEITVGNIAGIYIYENFLYALDMTGAQIKAYLEYSANYFNVIDEGNVDSISLVNPDIRGYNYDMAQGFLYDLDLTKESGNRIVNMKNLDGSTFDLDKVYNVTLNDYRYNGGGGHLKAAGLFTDGVINSKTTYHSSKPMRDLMVEYLELEGKWGPEDIVDNWKLVPESLSARAIENQLALNSEAR